MAYDRRAAYGVEYGMQQAPLQSGLQLHPPVPCLVIEYATNNQCLECGVVALVGGGPHSQAPWALNPGF